MNEKLKKLLLDIFAVLEFSEEEKKIALLDFEKKVAAEILRSVQDELPANYREYIERNMSKADNAADPMVGKIREELRRLHSKEEYQKMGGEILNRLLPKYIEYMGTGLSAEKQQLLEEKIRNLNE
jgi:vacuolar-type H+-ATPase subunit H